MRRKMREIIPIAAMLLAASLVVSPKTERPDRSPEALYAEDTARPAEEAGEIVIEEEDVPRAPLPVQTRSSPTRIVTRRQMTLIGACIMGAACFAFIVVRRASLK